MSESFDISVYFWYCVPKGKSREMNKLSIKDSGVVMVAHQPYLGVPGYNLSTQGRVG